MLIVYHLVLLKNNKKNQFIYKIGINNILKEIPLKKIWGNRRYSKSLHISYQQKSQNILLAKY